MDRESPEMIERDMHDTRQSLTDKVAALEVQVQGSFDHATTAVQDTVHSVKAAVEDTMVSLSDRVKESVTTVKDSVSTVKASLDVRDHIRDQPWSAIAGAALSGVIAGYLFGPGRRRANPAAPNWSPSPPPVAAPVASAQSEPSKPGLLDELLGRLRHEVKTLSENAILTLSSSLKETVNDTIQHLVKTTLTVEPKSNVVADESRRDSRHQHRNGVACDIAR
jgi:ElaB/YqjD/DUF883 family membrane-anchored ribosome-binding protein